MKMVKSYANNKVTSSAEMVARATELSLIQKVKRMEWAIKGCRKKIADLTLELEMLNMPAELR